MVISGWWDYDGDLFYLCVPLFSKLFTLSKYCFGIEKENIEGYFETSISRMETKQSN